MSTYLIINILIVIFPLLFSFERQVRFIQHLRHAIAAIANVSPVYIIWDAIAAARGDWGFSAEYTLGYGLFGLPFEELLFFVTVPYALLFTHEALLAYLPEKRITIPPVVLTGIGLGLAAGAVYAAGQYYTVTVLLFSAVFLLAAPRVIPGIINRRSFWVTIAVTYIPFFIVNYILTSLPVVWYSDAAFSGIRITTIPAEDLFYCFSMTAYWLSAYLWSKERHGRQ